MEDWDASVPVKTQTFFFFTHGMKTLWGLLGKEKKPIVLALSLMTVIKSLDLAFPLFLKIIFDEIQMIMTQHTVSKKVIWCIAGLFSVRMISLLIKRLFEEPTFVKSLLRLENWWPVMAQEKLLELSLSYHERENTGKKIAKINKGCEKLIEIMADLFWGLIPSLIYLTINIVLILCMNWILGLLFLLPLIPAVWINLKSYERFTPIWEEWEIQKEIATGLFCQSLINAQTVQGFVQEDREKTKLAAVRGAMERMDTKASLQVQKYFFAMGAILHIFFTITIATGIFLVAHNMSAVGTVVYIVATGSVTLDNLWQIVNVYTRILRNIIAAERMKKLMDETPEVDNMQNAITPSSLRGIIEFRCVRFAYNGQPHPVLDDISFVVRPGEMLALAGKSGSGKTTAIKLLARMYDATEGAILLDGTDIKILDRNWYRKLFAVVQQDVEIFDTTLVENITYANKSAPENEIKRALEAAHLKDAIANCNRFPKGLLTSVGERGVRLSGGERQRVGIARAYLALLGGARILILDEATSSLDSEAERAIQDMIDELRSTINISIVAIAHRLSTIQKADRICVLEEGKIIEEGSHKKLIQQNGLYAKLVNLQKLGELRE